MSELCGWCPAPGDVIGRYCPECKHSNVLHSPERPCAACEAIDAAVTARRFLISGSPRIPSGIVDPDSGGDD